MIAAGLLARNANKAGLLRKPGQVFAGAGFKAVTLYLEEAGLMPELEKLGFGVVAYACTSCNGMSGALDPVIQRSGARPAHRRPVGQPQLRRPYPPRAKQPSWHRRRWWWLTPLPAPSASISRRMCWAMTPAARRSR
jgi:hypothetical protein